ncbi:MAG: copper chaperone PCu(A)C [Ectothiorhodospiraceae bacterium]|nr:copper chaperone PCu(A)C [Ectothiorhodospiraceae bacterium]
MLKSIVRSLALTGLFIPLALPANGDVEVSDGWVRWMPPVAEHTAAYMTITNHGDQERRLVGGEASRFGKVEVHESREADGVARMIHLDYLAIPAHGSVELKPGGYHVMLMQRKGAGLEEGERITLELHFDDGGTKQLELPVKRGAHDHHQGGHGHHHGGHHRH